MSGIDTSLCQVLTILDENKPIGGYAPRSPNPASSAVPATGSLAPLLKVLASQSGSLRLLISMVVMKGDHREDEVRHQIRSFW